MASSLPAIGSGLDIPTLVGNLVANERKPVEDRINKQGAAATAQLSALGSIKSSLSSLQSSLDALIKSGDTFTFKTSVPDGSGFSATVVTDSSGQTKAAAGRYDVEVVSLAKQQKLTSGAFAADEVVGDLGKLTIAWGEESIEVPTGEGGTLADLAKAINKAANGKGVNASVITADDGQHLVLNAVNAGSKGALTITTTGEGRLGDLAWDGTSGGLTETVGATDAVVKVDGHTRTSSSNSISDLIPGVTLNLTKVAAEAGTTTTLTVSQDNSPLKINMQAFVSAYNASVNLLKSSSAYDATNNKASALTGDSLVRGLQQQLRNQLSANVNDMKALGLSINKDGTLAFSASAFDKTLGENPNAAAKLFGKDGTLSSSLSTVLKSNLDSGNGTLVMRTNSLDKQIKKLEKDFDDLDARMEQVEARYYAQFNAMESLVAQMQSTSSYLSQQLAGLQK